MRLTTQVIRSRAKKPLQVVEYLDLSSLEIVTPEKLGSCPKLQSLDLSSNNIDVVTNLQLCPELWSIDLSNNKINNLEGLNRFVALGNLVLSNNNLSWSELAKIQHIHILNLSLHGNKNLQKDPYYRIHVVDCLPNVWMLDGRFISSAERLQVEHFFSDSAFSDHPVRHKLKVKGFTPSNLKKIEVTGVFGERTTHLMTRFPTNGALNIEIDHRRMKYLAFNLQEDLKLVDRCLNLKLKLLKHSPEFLESVIDNRDAEREKCNMLLLLLVASLEFALPAQLVKATLEVAKLDKISNASTIELFLLPKRWRCMLACVLLGAVKLDRDKEIEGGLYSRLYLCLYHIVSELAKLCNADQATRENYQPTNPTYKDYRCLLASEIVQLLCIVPTFYQYLTHDTGVMNLVCLATDDYEIIDKVSLLMEAMTAEDGSIKAMYETIGDFVLKKSQDNAQSLFHRTKPPPASLKTDTLEFHSQRALPRRPQSSPVHRAVYHTAGLKSPDKFPPRVVPIKVVKQRAPYLGDRVLLGPQNEAKIISLPEQDIALVQIDILPVQGALPMPKASDNFRYVDLTTIEWDAASSFWRPKGSVGDRITFDTSGTSGQPGPLAATMSPRSPLEDQPQMEMSNNTANQLSVLDDSDIPSRPMSRLLCEKLDIQLGIHQGTMVSTVMSLAEEEKVKDMVSRNNIEPFEHGLASMKTSAKEGTAKEEPLDDEDSYDPVRSPLYDTINAAVQSFTGQPPKSADTLKVTPSSGVVSPVVICPTKGTSEKLRGKQVELNNNENNNNNFNENNNIRDDDQDSLCSADDPELGDLKSDISGPTTAMATFHSASRPDTAHSRQVPAVIENGDASLTNRERMNPVTIRLPGQRSNVAISSPQNSPVQNSSGYEIMYAPHRRMMNTPRSGRSMPGYPSPRSGCVAKQPRPISAVTAYKFIVSRSSIQNTPREDDITAYQKQRTEAWKRSSAEQNNKENEPAPPSTPPPQRPSSPENAERTFSLQFRNAQRWLGGGRDLYHEDVEKRPKSGHVPGWREGLDSSAPNRAFRRARPPDIVTPSSLYFEEFAAAGIDRRSFQHMLNISTPDLNVPNPGWHPAAQQGVRSWYLTSHNNARPDPGTYRRPYFPQQPPGVLCRVCAAREGECLHDYEYQLELIRAEHQRALDKNAEKDLLFS